MHRYWFEDAGSNLKDQMAFLREVKRLTRKDLETFTCCLDPSAPLVKPPQPAFTRRNPYGPNDFDKTPILCLTMAGNCNYSLGKLYEVRS
jgi:hypothetical protein